MASFTNAFVRAVESLSRLQTRTRDPVPPDAGHESGERERNPYYEVEQNLEAQAAQERSQLMAVSQDAGREDINPRSAPLGERWRLEALTPALVLYRFSNMEIVVSAKELKRVLCPNFVASIQGREFLSIEAAVEACTCLGSVCGKMKKCALPERGFETLGSLLHKKKLAEQTQLPDNIRRIDREVDSV